MACVGSHAILSKTSAGWKHETTARTASQHVVSCGPERSWTIEGQQPSGEDLHHTSTTPSPREDISPRQNISDSHSENSPHRCVRQAMGRMMCPPLKAANLTRKKPNSNLLTSLAGAESDRERSQKLPWYTALNLALACLFSPEVEDPY